MAAFTRGSPSSKHAAVVQPPKDMPVRAVRFTLTRPAKRLSCSQKIRDVFIFGPPHALTTACTPALLWGPFFCFQYPTGLQSHSPCGREAASHPRVIPDLLATRQLRHGIQQKHDILGSVCFHLWPLAPSSSWLNHSTVHLGISGTARVITGHHHKALRGQKLSEEDIAGAVGPRTMRENH